MAYRVPRHPRIEHHARHQTRLARLVGLALLWTLVLIMALLANRAIPRQHLPWKSLSVVDPVGMATRVKAARAGAGVGGARRTAGLDGMALASGRSSTSSSSRLPP